MSVKRSSLCTLFLLVLSTSFLLAAYVPYASATDYQFEHDKTGPFIDKFIVSYYDGIDNGIQQLMDNEYDGLDVVLDTSHVDELSEADDIEVTEFLRNGYGYFTINCQKYPFNLTALRRAMTFALDKYTVCAEALNGTAEPLDSVVPKNSPWSIEGQLDYCYYDTEIEAAEALLETAGFLDYDEDGIIEAPNGEDFHVLIEVAQSSTIAIECGLLLQEALGAICINATSNPTDFYDYLNRLHFHGDYDIAFLGTSKNGFDLQWLVDDYSSQYSDEPYANYPNWRNATFDSYGDQLLHSTDYDEVYEATIEMQKIFVHSCPIIVLYENIHYQVHRTERFTGFVNTVEDGITSRWSILKVRKNQLLEPFGGTLRWGSPGCFGWFNPLMVASCYPSPLEYMAYDSLILQGPDGMDVLWMADTLTIETHSDDPSVPEGNTRFTFSLLENMTWSDGEQITADDFAFTLTGYRDTPGNPMASPLAKMTAAYAKDTHTLVVQFGTESYWNLHNFCYMYVLPEHGWEDIDAVTDWNPIPPDEDWIVSGAFNVTAYEYEDDYFVEYTYRPSYFYAPDHNIVLPSDTTTLNGYPIIGLLHLQIIFIVSSIAVVVVVVILVFRRWR